jgi:chromate transporter
MSEDCEGLKGDETPPVSPPATLTTPPVTSGGGPGLRRYALGDSTLYALRLGALGFGRPVALVRYMRRDLVERRRRITEDQYAEGLALAQLAPGPLAAQLAMYLGHLRQGVRGAALVGAVFVAPAFLMVGALGWAYMRFGGLPWIHPVFYGVGACVIRQAPTS